MAHWACGDGRDVFGCQIVSKVRYGPRGKYIGPEKTAEYFRKLRERMNKAAQKRRGSLTVNLPPDIIRQ